MEKQTNLWLVVLLYLWPIKPLEVLNYMIIILLLSRKDSSAMFYVMKIPRCMIKFLLINGGGLLLNLIETLQIQICSVYLMRLEGQDK